PEPELAPERPQKSSARTTKKNRVTLSTERRQAPRAKVNLRVRWEGDLGRREAEVTSLSKSGCFVLSGGKVKAKELIRLDLMLPNEETIHLWAEVVEEADEIGFALKFTSSEETY